MNDSPTSRLTGSTIVRQTLGPLRLPENPISASSPFHAYDIRGVFDRDFNLDDAYRIGFFLPSLLEASSVLVGRDARTSSPAIFEALTRGIMDAGADVHDLGLATTPMVYWFTATLKFRASVMITASHNPAVYNGMKISTLDARPVGRHAGLGRLRDQVEGGQPCIAAEQRGRYRALDLRSEYLDMLRRHRPDLSGLKLIVDTANGMGGYLARDLLGDAPEYLFEALDGTFPNHEPNPLAHENLSVLKSRVVSERADIGIAFDGDADRVMFIDENGTFVPPDLIIGVLGLHYSHQGHTDMRVVQDIRTSRSVGEFLAPLGASVTTWKVGRAFASEKLREIDALFGGELAGHFYFREFFYSDSGMLASLKVLDVLARMKRGGISMSALISRIRSYENSGEINFRLERKQDAMDAVRLHYTTEMKPTAIHEFDGYRIEFDDWWFNIRQSNTEPYLRLVVEARTQEQLQRRRAELEAMIARFS